jgi:hypothetical protein
MCKRPSSTFVDNVRPSHATQFQSSYVLSRVPPSYPSANPQPSQTLPSESSELLVYSPKSLFNKCSSSALYSSSISKPSRSKAPSSSPLQRLCSSPVPLPCRHSLVVEQPTQSLLSPALLALHLRPPQSLSGRTKQLLGTIGGGIHLQALSEPLFACSLWDLQVCPDLLLIRRLCANCPIYPAVLCCLRSICTP